VGGPGAPPTHKIKENIWIFIVFGMRWGGGGRVPPPIHKIKENLWIFIVFGMGWLGKRCYGEFQRNAFLNICHRRMLATTYSRDPS
jgi:hypothetical protein